MRDRLLPSSAQLASEAFIALGLRKNLPTQMQKCVSGTRAMPTEAVASKRTTEPQVVRNRLTSTLLYALLPPPAFQALMELPDERAAASQWNALAHLTAERGREWDNLTDAMLHAEYEHPSVEGLRRIRASVEKPTPLEWAWMEDAFTRASGVPNSPERKRRVAAHLRAHQDALQEATLEVATNAGDLDFLNRLRALVVRVVVREIALREAAATVAWGLREQPFGPSWHLLPPMDWLRMLSNDGNLPIPKTTRVRWGELAKSATRLHWGSVEAMVQALATTLDANEEEKALLRLRVCGHLILRRLGVALRHTYADAHQVMATAYTNQVRRFMTALKKSDGVSVAARGGKKHDLRKLALFGPLPTSHGGWLVEQAFCHTVEDRLESVFMRRPVEGVLLVAVTMQTTTPPLRNVLATSGMSVRHPLGITPLLPRHLLTLGNAY